MKSLTTVSPVSVTATAQRVQLPNGSMAYTLRNTDTTNALYYAYSPTVAVATWTGIASALRTLGMSKLDAGESRSIIGFAAVDVVCATGLTATLEVEAGLSGDLQMTDTNSAAILAATQTSVLALSDPIALTTSKTVGYVGTTAGILGTTVALNAGIKVLTIIPSDATKVINWAMSKAATAGTAVWPAYGGSIRGTKSQLDLLQFFAAVAVNVTILQEG